MFGIRPSLLSLPERIQIVVIVGATVTSAFAAAIATRALFDINQLAADTGLTTTVYGVLGTIYAILLAFVVSGIWQNFSSAMTTVHVEADAVMSLMHIIEAFPEEDTKEIHAAVHSYAKMVIDEEWHELVRIARGYITAYDINAAPGPESVVALMGAVQSMTPVSAREITLFEQALVKLNNWLDARRERLQSASGGNAAALWPLLIAGASVLFAFHGLFVAKSIEVWAALLLGLSLVVGISFYLIFSLDSPFTGTLSAQVGPFRWVVNWSQPEKPPSPSGPAV
jgi:hypothetical protein